MQCIEAELSEEVRGEVLEQSRGNQSIFSCHISSDGVVWMWPCQRHVDTGELKAGPL